MNLKKLFNEWKWLVLVLVIILFIGLGLRVCSLTILPIFADEAIYIRWAQVMRAESTLRFLPLSDGKQPLFMWLMIPFLKLIQDPLFAGRFLSVLTGMGTILGVFVASYLLFKSKKVALIASFVYSLVPLAVFFDKMALADSMLTMFGVWILAIGIVLVRTLRLDVAMILGFVLGGALLTKSPALYFSLLLPTLVLFIQKKKDFWRYFILLIPTYLIGYGIFNILRLGPNFHMLALRNLDYVYPLSHLLSSPLDPFKPFVDRSKEFYWIMGGGSLMIMWLVSYLVNFKSKLKELFVLTVWFLGPILISSEFSKTMTARYVLFSLPFYVIIASAIFLINTKKLKIIQFLLISIFVVWSLAFNYKLLSNPETANLPRSERSGYLEEWTAGQGIREISDYLKSQSLRNNQTIVVGTEGYFGTLPDGLQIYFDSSLIPSNGSKVKVIGIGLQLDKVPEQLVDAKKAGDIVYMVVNNERMNTDYTKLDLKLIKEFKKATRPNGTTQSLLLFEVLDETISKF